MKDACAKRQIVGSCGPQIDRRDAPTLGGERLSRLIVRSFDMLSAEEPGINRPGAGSDHCQCRAKRG
jgi:hypothetical protein